MANSYDTRKDVLRFSSASDRAVNPARDAQTVTPNDSNDLPIYGKLHVFNAHATNVESVRVVPVDYTDDALYVDFNVAPKSGLFIPMIVRAVRSTGTGADITAIVMA
jgi:hypothetical protein